MPELLLVLGAWLAINLLASRRVIVAGRRVHLPVRMLLAAIWLLPFVGALVALLNTPSRRVADGVVAEAQPRDRGDAGEPPPATLAHAAGGPDFILADHLQWPHGLPLLDWQALDRWARGDEAMPAPEAQRVAALEQGRRAWLLHLGAALGPQMGLLESRDSWLLSSLNERQQRGFAEYVGTARARIARLLGELARFPAGQRSLVLVLDSEEDYYRYVSLYYPEGEFATSGGMFIDAGCPHFVVAQAYLNVLEPVIAHELTHSALAHLRLPRWLDEGIAVNSERRVAGAQPPLHTPHELHAMHRAHWSAVRVQGLWSGESFFRSDDDTLLSYELARIMVEQLSRQWEGFAAFVHAAAHAPDAGAAAARSVLGVELGALAAALVEAPCADGWEPRPSAWP